MAVEKKPRRNWRFIGGVSLLLAMFIGLLIYMLVYMVLPPLLTHEQLILWNFVGWTSDFSGKVRQSTLILVNNGTRRLTINSFRANGTLLNSTDLLFDGGLTLDPKGGIGPQGTRVAIVPKSFVFGGGASYNFTVGTASGNHYSFVLKCDEASIKPENLTIIEGDFVPGPDMHITVHYRNSGERPFIVTGVYLDGVQRAATFTDYWTWPGGEDAVIIWYIWKSEETYTITIKTAVGNTYETTMTAPRWP